MWCEKSHSAKETQTRLFSPQGSSWCLYIKTPGLPSFGVSWWLILCFNQCFDLFLNIPKQFLAPEPISRGRRKPKQTPGPQWGANQDVLTDKPANDFCDTFLTSQCGFYLSAKCYCYLRVADMTAAHACVHIMKICIWQGSIRLHGLRRRCLQINLQKRSHPSETDGLILVLLCLSWEHVQSLMEKQTNVTGHCTFSVFQLPSGLSGCLHGPSCPPADDTRSGPSGLLKCGNNSSRLSADRHFFMAESFFLLNDARFPQIKNQYPLFMFWGFCILWHKNASRLIINNITIKKSALSSCFRILLNVVSLSEWLAVFKGSYSKLSYFMSV